MQSPYTQDLGPNSITTGGCSVSVAVGQDAQDLEASSLPCLNSHISTEIAPKMTSNSRKSAFILGASVAKLADNFGLQNLGFLTLTFRENIQKPKEAQRRLNSLITHVIKPRYREYLGVMERQKSGRIHYHMLVVLNEDIRTGVNFDDLAQGSYKTAGKYLRSEWSYWRKTAPAYGFGRTELLPIRSSTEAITKYVGKYISKHMEVRHHSDKGARLVRYSRGARAGTNKFQFNSEGSKTWRKKVSLFAQILEASTGDSYKNMDDLSESLGSRWAYRYRDDITALPLDRAAIILKNAEKLRILRGSDNV